MVAAEDKAAALERELAGVREAALREGVVGGAFEDRLRAPRGGGGGGDESGGGGGGLARAVERRKRK